MTENIQSRSESRLTNLILGKSAPAKAQRRYTQCLNCQLPLSGRKDKKFCSPKCHDAFNNIRKANKREEWKKINHPMEQNDQFLAKLYAKDKNKDWPISMLDHPDFDSKAYLKIIKDDRIADPGKRFIHYSVHHNQARNTFRILYHEQCNL